MKKEKINQPVSNTKKSGAGSDPENKFKKGQKKSTFNSLENIINSPVTSTIARTGSGLTNEGTSVSYDEER
jgi:hypothetical protein